VSGRASGIKMVGMAEMGASICLDGVAVHLACWCICLCYLHFASENPEDGEMYLLVPAHPGYPGKSPESCKMIVCVCVILQLNMIILNVILTLGTIIIYKNEINSAV